MKHRPFDSIYKENFEVVAERQGNVTLYPHTTQLPLLLRALNHEFYGALPPRIARVDQRANGYDKHVLKTAVLVYANGINASRKDDVRLFRVITKDMVARLSIVQQITESHRLGQAHRFR